MVSFFCLYQVSRFSYFFGRHLTQKSSIHTPTGISIGARLDRLLPRAENSQVACSSVNFPVYRIVDRKPDLLSFAMI
jgi:hypothetical protein